MFTGYPDELTSDLCLRWTRLQEALRAEGADALLIATNVNLFYAVGRVFMGFVYLPAEGTPWFFVRRPVGLRGDTVADVRKPEQIPDLLRDAGLVLPRRILLETDDLTHSEWLRLSAVFSDATAADGSALLRRCRSIKTPYEISIMKMTGSRHAAVIPQYAAVYEPGMTDQAWSVEMFHLMLKAGSLGLFRIAGNSMEGFMGTVLAGDNGGAASPYDFALGGAGLHPSMPVGQSGVRLTSGMAVMVDIAANFYGYLTDCTRTFSIGPLAPQARDAHQVALEIQHAIAAAGVPGARCEDLYALALARASEAGLADCFMGLSQKAKFVGHGTGIVINEQPVLGARSTDTLAAGMCIALEPKFVIPGSGAVGVEDTFLVTPQGMQTLTPCDAAIIEL